MRRVPGTHKATQLSLSLFLIICGIVVKKDINYKLDVFYRTLI
jgi:hypothetical protein